MTNRINNVVKSDFSVWLQFLFSVNKGSVRQRDLFDRELKMDSPEQNRIVDPMNEIRHE